MDLTNPQVLFILGVGFLLVYFCIVACLMVFASPVLHYRKTKHQDEGLMLRFILIPFLLPARIAYSLVIGLAKMAKWLLFAVVGVIALILSPLYLLIYRPLIAYFRSYNEHFANFDKFVAFFRREIRLGNWLMFYKSEPINTQLDRSKTPHNYGSRSTRP